MYNLFGFEETAKNISILSLPYFSSNKTINNLEEIKPYYLKFLDYYQ